MLEINIPPDRGDIVWINFDPTIGHEQGGRRPALVLTPHKSNVVTDIAIICPITSKVKGSPFEVPVKTKEIEGAILSNQIRAVDFTSRGFEFIEKVDGIVLEQVVAKISALIL